MTTKFMNKVNGTAIQRVLIPAINASIEQNTAFLPRKSCKYLSFQSIFYANFDRFIDDEDEWFIKLRDELENAIKISFEKPIIDHMIWGKKLLDPKYEESRDR